MKTLPELVCAAALFVLVVYWIAQLAYTPLKLPKIDELIHDIDSEPPKKPSKRRRKTRFPNMADDEPSLVVPERRIPFPQSTTRWPKDGKPIIDYCVFNMTDVDRYIGMLTKAERITKAGGEFWFDLGEYGVYLVNDVDDVKYIIKLIVCSLVDDPFNKHPVVYENPASKKKRDKAIL